MIESSDVGQLFEFFSNYLISNDYRLDSSNQDTKKMLPRTVAAPHGSSDVIDATKSLELDFSVEEFGATLTRLGTGAELM